jgi:hypothetical protein
MWHVLIGRYRFAGSALRAVGLKEKGMHQI